MPKEIRRDYKMSDADLIQRADLLAISIARDADAFTTRLVDAARIAILTNARDAFDDTTTDVEWLGMVSDKTETKEAARRDLELSIRSLRNMADIVFEGKGLYHTFGFEKLSRLKDNDLYRATKRVVWVATLLLAELGPQGLTEEKINALSALNLSFDNALDELGQAMAQREMESIFRIKLGNVLWKKMTDLASIGKSLFEDTTDEARYNDYVLEEGAKTARKTGD
ncbi:MAG: hypothetical protein ABI169_18535 [Chitinophagaceae bacterium]